MWRTMLLSVGFVLLTIVFAGAQSNQNQYYLNFDGDDYVKYFSDSYLERMDGATDYTIEAWVNPDANVQTYDRVLQRYYSFNVVIWHITEDKDSCDWYFTVIDDDGNNHYFNAKQSIAFGQWNHIAVISNSTEGYLKLFVNGVDVSKESYSNFPLRSAHSSDNFYVGQKGNGADFFSGGIDEVRLKNIAEDPDTLYWDNTTTNYAPDANTAMLLHFDEGQGSWTVNAASTENDSARLGGTDVGDEAEPTWVKWIGAAIPDADPNFLPQAFTVKQNYPNPFNPSTVIPFLLPKAGQVSVSVYNLAGEKIWHKTASFAAGTNQLKIQADHWPAGAYIYKVSFGRKSLARKMVLLK